MRKRNILEQSAGLVQNSPDYGSPEDCSENEKLDISSTKNLAKPSSFGQLKPVFLNEYQRTFANPISYLGGPQLPSRSRWSIESVMSLD